MSSEPECVQKPSGIPLWLIVAIGLPVVLLVIAAGGSIVAFLFLPTFLGTNEPARRSQCLNNLRQIGVALHNYHDTYQCFPPAFVADADGKPMHSWRVLLLPHLGYTDLYKLYNFDEPWDGPHNRELADLIGTVYQCSHIRPMSPSTSYVAVVGDGTMWPGAKSTTRASLLQSGGLPDTIMLVETTDPSFHAIAPRDLTLDEASQGINPKESARGMGSKHPGGMNVLFADGRCDFLPATTPPEKLQGLLKVNETEPK